MGQWWFVVTSSVIAILSGIVSLHYRRVQEAFDVHGVAHSKWHVAVKLGGIGWALGHLAVSLRPFCRIGPAQIEAIGAIVFLLGISLWQVVRGARSDGSYANRIFQSDLMALWVSFIAGWRAAEGDSWDEVVTVIGAWYVGCGLFGGLVIYYCQRYRRRALRGYPKTGIQELSGFG